ncbi:hypothetical protein D3C86_2178230 [compost metagenome]
MLVVGEQLQTVQRRRHRAQRPVEGVFVTLQTGAMVDRAGLAVFQRVVLIAHACGQAQP